MLSRVADSLYWMSRYLERAEHTARLVNVNLNLTLDRAPANTMRHWGRLLASLRMPPKVADVGTVAEVAAGSTLDLANRDSIAACIAASRENARQVREQISSEMWEQLNRLTLRVKGTGMEEIWHTEPHEFFQSVKDGAHLFLGITDATMSHGEGWQFIQLGRFIERAAATAALLDIYLPPHIEQQRASPEQLDYLGLVGVLKSCTAFEAYCQVYTAHVQPQSIAEFLLLNAECPRSVRFAVESLQAALQTISKLTGVRKAGRAERLAGRLRASLEYGQVDEIIAGNLGAFLEDIQRRCNQLHAAIHQTYIAYPIDTALAS
jgi:uncharacterized alpha-E superfamily protein